MGCSVLCPDYQTHSDINTGDISPAVDQNIPEEIDPDVLNAASILMEMYNAQGRIQRSSPTARHTTPEHSREQSPYNIAPVLKKAATRSTEASGHSAPKIFNQLPEKRKAAREVRGSRKKRTIRQRMGQTEVDIANCSDGDGDVDGDTTEIEISDADTDAEGPARVEENFGGRNSAGSELWWMTPTLPGRYMYNSSSPSPESPTPLIYQRRAERAKMVAPPEFAMGISTSGLNKIKLTGRRTTGNDLTEDIFEAMDKSDGSNDMIENAVLKVRHRHKDNKARFVDTTSSESLSKDRDWATNAISSSSPKHTKQSFTTVTPLGSPVRYTQEKTTRRAKPGVRDEKGRSSKRTFEGKRDNRQSSRRTNREGRVKL